MDKNKDERISSELEFPSDFFDPPNPRPEWWPDNPDLRKAVDFFKSFMSAEQWIQRREQAARRLHLSASGVKTDNGRFFDSTDSFGWYLFLAEAILDHIHNYECIFGSRVIPLFEAIGRDLELLKQVGRINYRVRRLVNKERSQPNGGLFELLVAGCYLRNGAKVSFVEELPGKAKTHDMDVMLDGKTWAVECKRMELTEYAETERLEIGRLWSNCSLQLLGLERNTLCKVSFLVELKTVSSDYLNAKVIEWLQSHKKEFTWNDATSTGSITSLDLTPLQDCLSSDLVLETSHRILELLTGSYIRNAKYQSMLRTKKDKENPRYVSECDLAVVLNWESLSVASIDSKARDIRKKLFEANAQLPDGRPSIVHIGFEAVEGDKVERLRHEKIITTASQFKPGDKQLEFIYCHYFVPESPPNQSWAFDETTQWCAIRTNQKQPLQKLFLVLPTDGDNYRDGPHWQE